MAGKATTPAGPAAPAPTAPRTPGGLKAASAGGLPALVPGNHVKSPAEVVRAREGALRYANTVGNKVSLNGGKTFMQVSQAFGSSRLKGCVDFSATTKRTRAGIPGAKQEDLNLPNKEQKAQICAAPIAFVEQEYPARENDYRIFVEGVELSGYVRGALTWTLESTGGTNSCRFSLNNNQDAFIITPLNVCSNLSLNGWRVDTANLYAPSMHSEARYDELAKYLIYKRKFERVAPGTSKADIDPGTGMWYYPLAPMGLIFNKHDAVRVFRKLSHIDAARVYSEAGNTGELRSFDLWAPAFTGFIKSASYTDDYIMGDRSVTIECYDFRGLMEGMRVRTVGLRLGTNGPGSGAKVGPTTPMEKALGKAGFALAAGTDLISLLNSTYQAYEQACTAEVAATAQINTASGANSGANDAILAKLSSCLQIITAQVKPLADEASKLLYEFGTRAAALQKLSGLKSVLTLEESVADNSVRFNPAGTKSESANAAAGGTAPGTPTNPTGTQSSPSLSAPTVSGEALAKYAQDPKLGSPITSISLTANGDMERLDAVADFILRRPHMINIYASTSGEACVKDGVLTWDKSNNQAELDIQECCNIAAGSTETAKQQCNAKWMQHLACLISKSVISYAYAQMSTNTHLFLVKNGCTEGNNLVPPLYKLSDSGKAGVFAAGSKGIDIYSDTDTDWAKIRNGLYSTKKDLLLLIEESKKPVKKAASDLWHLRKKIIAALAAANKAREVALGKAGEAKLAKFVDFKAKFDAARADGQKVADAKGVPSAGNLGDIILNEPTFEARQAGIFADLIKKVDQGTHPLEGMSYEASVIWLCCAPTTGGGGPGCLPGRLETLSRGYAPKALDKWNRLVLFGLAERPLTFDEVTAIGQESGSDAHKETFSPYKPLLHMMLPARGTGARTIVQQDLTANTGNSTSFQYETRKSLVDRISTLLNYQWYVSPWGDLIFEFPHYNSEPHHWGDTFKGAYTLDKEITGITVNEESSDLYTAWVVTGMEASKEPAAAGSSLVAQNQFYKVSIMCPILARRVGVRVENINIELPGVGAQIDGGNSSPAAGGVESLIAWALLHIQRQLGEAHRVNINDFPDRPYLLPNRPLYIVPRQKFCLTKSVTYTMDKPNGDATVSVECGFTRWLFRDGSFRQVAGGKGSIVDYTCIFTGASSVILRESQRTSSKTFGQPSKKSQDKADTSWDCGSLNKAAENSQSWYGQDIAGMGAEWSQYSGNTSGAAGLPGFIPPNSDLGQGQYGTTTLTKPANPKDKDASGNGNDPSGAGLRVEGKNPPTIGTAYNLKNLFLDPYPFGRPSSVTFGKKTKQYDLIHQFGFLKSTYANSGVSFRAKRGDLEVGFHAGIDIWMPGGEQMVVPFDADALDAELNVGSNQHKSQKKTWVTVGYLAGGTSFLYVPEWKQFSTGAAARYKGASIEGEVYALPYSLYLDQKTKIDANGGRGKNFSVSTGGSGAGGIMLLAYGNVTAPSGSGEFEGKTVRVKLRFLHCKSILKGSNGYYGLDEKSASKGTPVCTLGLTGTNVAHAHIELSIAKPGSAADRHGTGDSALFDEARKANNEFLTTQLLLKVTGGKPDSGKLSPEWQAYFKEWSNKKDTNKAGVPTPITTPSEAVAYLLATQKDYDTVRSGLTGDDFSVQSGWMLTNPLFFFKPEELVPAFAKYADKYDYPPKDVPAWNSQAFAGSIGSDPASVAPMCGKMAEEYKQRIQHNFSACMIAARQKASSSYGSYSTATVKCRKNVKTDIDAVNAEARKKEEEDAVKKAAAVEAAKARRKKR